MSAVCVLLTSSGNCRPRHSLLMQDDDFEASDEEDELGRPVANAKELAGMKVSFLLGRRAS